MSSDTAGIIKQLISGGVGVMALVLLGWYLYVQNENAEKDRSLAITILQQTLEEAKVRRQADMDSREQEQKQRNETTSRFLNQQRELVEVQRKQNDILTAVKQSNQSIVPALRGEHEKLIDRMVDETKAANENLIKILAAPKSERKQVAKDLLPDE